MSSSHSVSPAPSWISTPGPDTYIPTPYFNETGPIYETEHPQAEVFVKFVRDHVVVETNENTHSGRGAAWFNWEAFHAVVASLKASDILVERDLAAVVPPTRYSNSRDVADTTVLATLDALVARFSSTFADVLFVRPTSDTADMDQDANPQVQFFGALRRNLYDAFTRQLREADAPERCLSFHKSMDHGADASERSGWEYRLLFVHSDKGSGSIRGLVMTVTLEGSFEDWRGEGKRDGEEPWYSISLDSRGPFSGTLKAMQVVVGEGFQCP